MVCMITVKRTIAVLVLGISQKINDKLNNKGKFLFLLVKSFALTSTRGKQCALLVYITYH